MIFIMENENITKPRKYFEGRGYHREYFCSIDTEEKAYILGFLWGDGSYIPSKRTIALALAVKDEDHLRKMARCIGLDDGQVRTHTSKGFNNQEFAYVKMQMAHETFFKSMERLGYGKKRERMRKIPEIPQQLVRHFLRGLFDADGSVSLKGRAKRGPYHIGRMELSLPHLDAVSWWREYLMSVCGVEFSFAPDKRIYRVTLTIHDSLVSVYHYLYDDSTIYLERKHNKFRLLAGDDNHPAAAALPAAA